MNESSIVWATTFLTRNRIDRVCQLLFIPLPRAPEAGQAGLGRATTHMARHYTDPITKEDLKIAKHLGEILVE